MSVQATTWVWEHSKTGGSERLILLAIADAANREGEASCQSVATLARMTCLSESTVHRVIARLLSSGELESMGISPRYKTNVFKLPLMGGYQSDTPRVSDSRKPGVTGDTRPQRDNPNENLSSPQVTEGKFQVPESRAFINYDDDDFNEWWTLYPKKGGKKQAFVEWKKAVKRADPSCILAGLRAQLAAPTVSEAKFWKDPERWLKYDRWDDDSIPINSKRRRNYDDYGNPLPLPGEPGYNVDRHGPPPDPRPGEPGYGVRYV